MNVCIVFILIVLNGTNPKSNQNLFFEVTLDFSNKGLCTFEIHGASNKLVLKLKKNLYSPRMCWFGF